MHRLLSCLFSHAPDVRHSVRLTTDEAQAAYSLLSHIIVGGHIDYEAASRLRDAIASAAPELPDAYHHNINSMSLLPELDRDVALLLKLQLGMATVGGKSYGRELSTMSDAGDRSIRRMLSTTVRTNSVVAYREKWDLRLADTDWEFDVAHLNLQSDGHALSILATHFITRCGAVSEFRLDERKLATCMRAIEAGYRINPYHNSVHAACVLQHLHLLLNSMAILDAYSRLMAYLAAIVHDYGHIGLTNAYLVSTGHTFAITHNDSSPMENHSLQSVFRLMAIECNDFMADMPSQKKRDTRRDLIALVMATDMTRHMSYHSRFCAIHMAASDQPDQRDSTEPRIRDLQFALKCADLGHTFMPVHLHVRWVSLLEQECFLQGDMERSRGMPVTPLFDRSKPGITRSQVGFFQVVVLPMLTAFVRVYPLAACTLAAAMRNAKHWAAQDESASSLRLSAMLQRLDTAAESVDDCMHRKPAD